MNYYDKYSTRSPSPNEASRRHCHQLAAGGRESTPRRESGVRAQQMKIKRRTSSWYLLLNKGRQVLKVTDGTEYRFGYTTQRIYMECCI